MFEVLVDLACRRHGYSVAAAVVLVQNKFPEYHQDYLKRLRTGKVSELPKHPGPYMGGQVD
jgi:hypothetical protein